MGAKPDKANKKCRRHSYPPRVCVKCGFVDTFRRDLMRERRKAEREAKAADGGSGGRK
jgi:hypothetical protein